MITCWLRVDFKLAHVAVDTRNHVTGRTSLPWGAFGVNICFDAKHLVDVYSLFFRIILFHKIKVMRPKLALEISSEDGLWKGSFSAGKWDY